MIDEAGVNRMVGEIEARLGGVDIVVANATPDQPQKPIELYDWENDQDEVNNRAEDPALESVRQQLIETHLNGIRDRLDEGKLDAYEEIVSR